ncbi:Protein of unknown function [Ruminococcus sp. YE71]|uniref:cell division protein SepF n=1 Tax=unclassified Ruminococcus TaxID=2608920 RepID=UPI000883792B|nr:MULTISPECIES: cell division protein SepF [unclassified Ruminococcus]SDA13654.1 Protein of unknown function [Ruminococcus sp. YE78]SFW19449.1 Protein of unknown function [Ruminococcus sp. YE71]
MGLWQGFKSMFVGDDEIDEEIYSNYTPKSAAAPQPEQAPPPQSERADQERAVRDEAASARRSQAQGGASSRRQQQTAYQSAARNERGSGTGAGTGTGTGMGANRGDGFNNAGGRNDAYGSQRRNNERESDIHMATTDQSSFDLVLARPNNFKEVEKIGNDINNGRTVILNLELVKSEDATRILDFIWGVAFANQCEIKMMAQKTYAIIPGSVNFSGVDLVSELENNGYSF